MDNPEKDRNTCLPSPAEQVRLGKPIGRSILGIFAFLICSALLVAAFAVSGVWSDLDGELLGKLGISFGKRKAADTEEAGTVDLPSGNESETDRSVEESSPKARDDDPETPPTGAVAIIAKTLGASATEAVRNETPYLPTASEGEPWRMSSAPESGNPVVLILHTHAQEAYLNEACDRLEGSPGDVTYSADPSRNVSAVGAALCKRLNELGIPTVHGTEQSPGDDALQGAYSRAADRIADYRKRYPSIRLVIDLHRDAIMDGDGNYIKSICEGGEAPMAQVMAVVGTDGNGTAHEHWRENLSLALALREILNKDDPSVCRPVSLKNSSYNQELAPHALLLEIGTGGNTVEEAIRAAETVGNALAQLLLPEENP